MRKAIVNLEGGDKPKRLGGTENFIIILLWLRVVLLFVFLFALQSGEGGAQFKDIVFVLFFILKIFAAEMPSTRRTYVGCTYVDQLL